VNCIFTLYAFHSVDSKNDDECEATLQPMVEYSTFLISLFFSTPFLLFFFSIILLPPPAFACVHSHVLPFPLLFAIIFQLHSLHSYCCEFQNFKNTQLPVTSINCFQRLFHFFTSLNILPITFIFSSTHYLLINT